MLVLVSPELALWQKEKRLIRPSGRRREPAPRTGLKTLPFLCSGLGIFLHFPKIPNKPVWNLEVLEYILVQQIRREVLKSGSTFLENTGTLSLKHTHMHPTQCSSGNLWILGSTCNERRSLEPVRSESLSPVLEDGLPADPGLSPSRGPDSFCRVLAASIPFTRRA